MEKDKSIRDLLSFLELQKRGWTLVDHWEADLCAIGVARDSEPRCLVYVSTYGKASGNYDYECEVRDTGQSADYRTVAGGQDVRFEELIAVLEKHLGQRSDSETVL